MTRFASAAWAGRIVHLLQAAALLALLAPTAALAQRATPVPSTPIRARDAPAPVTFPRDDGPHDVGIEWWYYTGHLYAPDGRLFGFEFVIFKGREQGVGGVAAHFAITDNAAGQFHYAEKRAGLAGVVGRRAAMDLTVDGWTMLGQNGDDRLRAAMPGDAGYALDLLLTSRKPPALHDGDGYIAYGDGTASYYYSRTDLAVTGRLEAGGATMPVTGTAWMDHQWGDFKTFETGGWDWFALDLNDDRQIMLYLIRNQRRDVVLVDGSIVAPDGGLTVLGASDFTVRPLGTWTSRATRTTYPSAWLVDIPGERLRLTIVPTMPDQELDT
ncbi:MAG TPA: carotenoid 1,2-hydratase, partial [Thermomicrobiales bacterium]|nr:carotenoid 1,2-hydratase [Thermomicrobiales bacterium]